VDFTANGTYSDDLYADRADRIFRSHAADLPDSPLFLYFAMQATHTPLQAPQRFLDLYAGETNVNRTKLKAVASAMDETVGKMVASLKATGLYENTIILFLGDNGGASGAAGGASNYPLRGSKGSLWEGGVRTPAFLHSPLLGTAGRTETSIIHATDWLPTLLRSSNVRNLVLDPLSQSQDSIHSANPRARYSANHNTPSRSQPITIRHPVLPS
jgi:arylsulfatase A-like enzyme